ncbi:MAG: hypothetical protein NTY20_03425 [Candidatus Aenigmarchaeota archaeon]|nr:hypothetical protein [Candidatus Aenigmarchaeota archaeon]
MYYYQYKACKTVVIDDDSKSIPSISEYKCPACFPEQKKFPFEYVTAD